MLFVCSVIAQCSSTPDTDCPVSLTLGLVLTAKWATPAGSASVALWRAWWHQSWGPTTALLIAWASKCPSMALLSPCHCTEEPFSLFNPVTFLVDRRQFFLTRVDYIAKSHRPTIERDQPWPSAHPGSVAKWRQQSEVKKKQYMRNWKRELDSNLYESEVMKCRKSIREVKDIGRKSRAERAKDSSIKKSFINI